jgi:hypothetical protein
MALHPICFAKPRESSFRVESISRKPYDAAKTIATGVSTRSRGDRKMAARDIPSHRAAGQGRRGEVFFWDESGFRAEAVHGRTWRVKKTTPFVERPGRLWCKFPKWRRRGAPHLAHGLRGEDGVPDFGRRLAFDPKLSKFEHVEKLQAVSYGFRLIDSRRKGIHEGLRSG